MRLGTAIERLVDNYRYASDKEWIRDKVAWALYHTWKEADRKTENNSEKPNNCEDCANGEGDIEACGYCRHGDLYKPKDEPTISKMEQVEDEPKTQMKTQNSNLTFEKADEFKQFDREALILLIECQKERIAELLAKTEPQIVGKHADMVIIDESQKWETPPKFEHKGFTTTCVSVPACLLEIEDEPQTDAEITELAKEIVHKMIDNSDIAEDAYPDLKQRMHEAVERLDEYYPSEDERSE